MTEEPKVDGLAEDGAVSQPASAVSDSAQTPIAEVTALKAKLFELEKQFSGLQGRQDKADNNLGKAQEAIDRYQSLLDKNLSPAEAKATMVKEDEAKSKDRMLEELYDAVVRGKLSGVTGTNTQQTSEATRIIQELGLDGNSAEVNAVLAEGLEGLALENKLLRLSLPKNAASAPPPKTPNPVVPASEAALVNQYVTELQAAGTSRAAASEIRARYEKLGVNTGAVVFH